MVGPYFLHYIIRELKFRLTKGWEGHILNYTVFLLIMTVSEDNKNNPNFIGSLDYCLIDILPLLINETFGELRHEKEDLEIGTKLPEMRK